MKVLSLFDGMACGALALQKVGMPIEEYNAFEIDKYAIQTSSHNFPFIKHYGDVFGADFTQFKGCDILMGGSPCTYWSIAKKEGRETTASGIGWELFCQYVRAIKEAEPRYFVYENNKSMSNAIRDSISESFGFEPILINSALVSAQNRQRLYWVGRRNADGTYSKVNVTQPKDRGILLKDIFETVVTEKAYCLRDFNGKSQRIKAQYQQTSIANICGDYSSFGATGVAEVVRCGDIGSTADAHRVYSSNGKSRTIKANAGGCGGKTGLYLCPADSKKAIPIYEVKNGMITHNGRSYPIKLADGYYIIRKLTVRECMRLQTVPEWYEFPVSNTQAYKMLGNGWTVDVIAHILSFIKEEKEDEENS